MVRLKIQNPFQHFNNAKLLESIEDNLRNKYKFRINPIEDNDLYVAFVDIEADGKDLKVIANLLRTCGSIIVAPVNGGCCDTRLEDWLD